MKKRKKMKTLDLVLTILGIFIGLFIITMIVLFICFRQVPDVLIVSVLGSGSSEAVLCCIIACVKKKAGLDNNDNDM